MSKPSSRQGLIDYCLRRLGYPVLEINIEDDQIDDLVDDAIQYFNERHYDGIEKVFLKHKLDQTQLDTIRTGVTTSTASSAVGITTVAYTETNNFLQLPDHVIGVNNVFKVDSSTISSGLFNIKYQLFLNDLYYYGALDLLNYAMVKTYLEDLSRIITPDIQIRFNKKNHRLYLDIDWSQMGPNNYLIFDCYRLMDPSDAPSIYNDWWLKKYLTALMKRQWGINLSKFQGVSLPGGIQFNGERILNDGIREVEEAERHLKYEYETPPMDMIG